MKIYCISGLGADKRVFDFLSVKHEVIPLEWIDIIDNETIESYSNRLADKIDKNEEFVILVVSFGGLIAVEISKILNPKATILISSIETRKELGNLKKTLGKLGLLKITPKFLLNPPKLLAYYLFGAENKSLLKQILDDTDFKFVKWSLIELLQWKNETVLSKLIRIHGTSDKLLPYPKSSTVIPIEKGEHFMIVDRADEISEIINEKLNEKDIK